MGRVAATSSYTVDFRPERAPTPAPAGRVPRVVRLLALAHRIDEMIRTGQIEDLATAARLCGVTRARMTQISNLLLLAPEIQEEILDLPPVTTGRDSVTERNLRNVVAEPDWRLQGTIRNLSRRQASPGPRPIRARDRRGCGSTPKDRCSRTLR